MPDKELVCSDCGFDFNFSERDQEFFLAQGFQPPKRCPKCRAAKKARRLAEGRTD